MARPDHSPGLSPAEAQARMILHGRNELLPPPTKPEWLRFAEKFLDPFMVLLELAALLSFIMFAIKNTTDGVEARGNLYVGVVLVFIITRPPRKVKSAYTIMLTPSTLESRSHSYRDILEKDEDMEDDDGVLPRLFEGVYAGGVVAGKKGADTLTIGGVQLEGMKFGQAMYEDEELMMASWDGVLGLGFKGLAGVTKPTVLDAMKAQHPDLPRHFSVFLSADAGWENGPTSELRLGGFDLGKVGGNASWHFAPLARETGDWEMVVPMEEEGREGRRRKMDSSDYWSVRLTSVDVRERDHVHPGQGQVVELLRGEGKEGAEEGGGVGGGVAIVDTGTTLFIPPSREYHRLLILLTQRLHCTDSSTYTSTSNPLYGWLPTCYGASLSDFPDLVLHIEGGPSLPLRAEDYVSCSLTICVLLLQEVTDNPFWVLGDVVLESYYMLFDVENQR
eukprot:evm.model.NODE_20732_length_13560_cov_37.012463.1